MLEFISQNLALRAALAARRPSLFNKLRHITFDAGHQFWPANGKIPFVLFPLRGVVSLQRPVPPNKRAEIALVGREGFVGAPIAFSVERSVMLAVALTPGDGMTMSPAVFRAYLKNAQFESAVNLYLHSFMVMLGEISLCNRVHVIEKLWIGRLLMMQDRTQSATFEGTQDFFSRSLGVRRASVSRAAGHLKKLGAIEYDHRGRLTILDRTKLEKLACSCYHVIKAEYDRFLQAS